MEWMNYCIEVPAAQVAAAETALLDAGAQSVSVSDAGDEPLLEDTIDETPLWSRVRLAGLFPGDADSDEVRLRLAATLGETGLDVQRVELADRDWARAWLERLEPMRFGRRLWVLPGETKAPATGDAVTVRLDPGLAFGTGTHATTALCLEWLDNHPPEGLTVVDYGCGSGILALAAARLGATSVWCTDTDSRALDVTRENAERNGLAGRLRPVSPEDLPSGNADLLLANILWRPLCELAPRFASLSRPGALIVMSGVLASQAEMLVAEYRFGFRDFVVAERDGWARVTAKRID